MKKFISAVLLLGVLSTAQPICFAQHRAPTTTPVSVWSSDDKSGNPVISNWTENYNDAIGSEKQIDIDTENNAFIIRKFDTVQNSPSITSKNTQAIHGDIKLTFSINIPEINTQKYPELKDETNEQKPDTNKNFALISDDGKSQSLFDIKSRGTASANDIHPYLQLPSWWVGTEDETRQDWAWLTKDESGNILQSSAIGESNWYYDNWVNLSFDTTYTFTVYIFMAGGDRSMYMTVTDKSGNMIKAAHYRSWAVYNFNNMKITSNGIYPIYLSGVKIEEFERKGKVNNNNGEYFYEDFEDYLADPEALEYWNISADPNIVSMRKDENDTLKSYTDIKGGQLNTGLKYFDSDRGNVGYVRHIAGTDAPVFGPHVQSEVNGGGDAKVVQISFLTYIDPAEKTKSHYNRLCLTDIGAGGSDWGTNPIVQINHAEKGETALLHASGELGTESVIPLELGHWYYVKVRLLYAYNTYLIDVQDPSDDKWNSVGSMLVKSMPSDCGPFRTVNFTAWGEGTFYFDDLQIKDGQYENQLLVDDLIINKWYHAQDRATGIITTISNVGVTPASLNKRITYTLTTSDGTSKSFSADLTLKLDKGAQAVYGIGIDGLYDDNLVCTHTLSDIPNTSSAE
ncbi:MAG: hypothetical protein PUD92_08605 [Clostridiales bacterium]|nr:hypothetical protein [Clostridiales bacterium]